MVNFNVKKEELSSYLKDGLYILENQTALKFKRAEDWTSKNQGLLLVFGNSLYLNENQTLDDVKNIIQWNFGELYNPSLEINSDGDYIINLDEL